MDTFYYTYDSDPVMGTIKEEAVIGTVKAKDKNQAKSIILEECMDIFFTEEDTSTLQVIEGVFNTFWRRALNHSCSQVTKRDFWPFTCEQLNFNPINAEYSGVIPQPVIYIIIDNQGKK